MEEENTTKNDRSSTGKIVTIVVILLLILGGAVYVYHKSHKNNHTAMIETTKMPSTTAPKPTTTAVKGAATQATAQDITVEGGNYYFKPNQITVKKDSKVTITFKNTDGFHDFVINEFNIKTPLIKTDGTATVSFIADKAGTFQYYCNVANHRSMGMQGTLVVE